MDPAAQHPTDPDAGQDEPPAPLRGSDRPLVDLFDVALLDLDGVVYIGSDAVPGAAHALRAARDRGLRLAFVTNNAARPPDSVAEHLTRLGVPADAADVITSAQAAARWLAERLTRDSAVLVVGTVGLEEALREQHLRPVSSADDGPAAVVQGYSPHLDWALLAEGAVAVRAGLPWVATNLDVTIPSPRGPLPGNGAFVAALRAATGCDPVATGKPDPSMHRESLIRSGAARPVVVGDRLDTDIEGAAAVGCPSLLVLSGVTDAATLLGARPDHRPTHLARDVRGLLDTHPAVERDGTTARCRGWEARGDHDGVTLARSHADGDTGVADQRQDADLDALRALAVACWAVRDAGTTPGTGPAHGRHAAPSHPPALRPGDVAARATLERLGLLRAGSAA